MKKLALSIGIVAVISIVLATAGFVYAQSSTPPTPFPGMGHGFGMGEGRSALWGMQGQGAMAGVQGGILHDEMMTAYADKLGISVEDLNVRLANGETMAQIASSQGLTVDQFRTLMNDAHTQAIDQAVKNGDLTQAQADWMKLRGAGMVNGGRGMHGGGQGRNANPGCPYYSANP